MINIRRGYYTCTVGAPKYIKQMLADIKGEIGNDTIIVGVFNTPLTSMDRSSRQKINKARTFLNDTVEQLDLIDVYRALCPKQKTKTKNRIHVHFKLT